MRLLVFGAGVLGSLYAARLKQSGQDVTILARQQRFADIQEQGIILEHALSRKDVITLSCALNGEADLFITGDRELLDLAKIGNMEIVSPRVFWEKAKLPAAGRGGFC